VRSEALSEVRKTKLRAERDRRRLLEAGAPLCGNLTSNTVSVIVL
jgi:hypothetical protein